MIEIPPIHPLNCMRARQRVKINADESGARRQRRAFHPSMSGARAEPAVRGTDEAMSAFTTREESDVLVVALTDPASLNDFRNTPFRDELLELVKTREEPRLALDMEKVDYLSSSGVAVLVGLKRRLDSGGGKLVFFRLRPVVLDLLRVMRLDQHLNIAENEEQALASLRSIPSA